MTTTFTGHQRSAEVLWPMDSRRPAGQRQIVRVVWRVPDLAQFSPRACVTEIYDINDVSHRRMIDLARFRLRYELVSITNYNPALKGEDEKEFDLDDEPLEMTDVDLEDE